MFKVKKATAIHECIAVAFCFFLLIYVVFIFKYILSGRPSGRLAICYISFNIFFITKSSCFLCSSVYSPQGIPCSSSTSMKSKSDNPESSADFSNVTVLLVNKFSAKASLTFWSIESPAIRPYFFLLQLPKILSGVSLASIFSPTTHSIIHNIILIFIKGTSVPPHK